MSCLVARRLPNSTEKALLDEAAAAFVGMDEFVDALPILVSDDGEATIEQMAMELRARAAKFPRNPVVQSTAAGLEKAYRLSILQRVIDLRLGTDRPPEPDNTARRK